MSSRRVNSTGRHKLISIDCEPRSERKSKHLYTYLRVENGGRKYHLQKAEEKKGLITSCETNMFAYICPVATPKAKMPRNTFFSFSVFSSDVLLHSESTEFQPSGLGTCQLVSASTIDANGNDTGNDTQLVPKDSRAASSPPRLDRRTPHSPRPAPLTEHIC